MENWKPVKGYEDTYEVSDLGRVRRLDSFVDSKNGSQRFAKGGILAQSPKNNGYLQVVLFCHQQRQDVGVHRLVAEAFCERRATDTQVNHINCNKRDNRAVNLEWCTPEENRSHAKENGRYVAPNKKAVKCIELDMVFESSFRAAEYINQRFFENTKQVKNMACRIRGCATGHRKTAFGFTWK